MQWEWIRKIANVLAIIICIALLLSFTSGKLWNVEEANRNVFIGDSGIFYESANNLAHGKSPYMITEDGLKQGGKHPGALYCYLPTLATILAPFSDLSVRGKTVVWYSILVVSIILSIYMIFLISVLIGIAPPKGWRFPVTVGITALLFEPIQNNFIYAQSNTLLLLTIVGFMLCYLKRNLNIAGVILGFGIVLKFFPLIFIPFLFFRKEWRVMIIAGISCLCFLLIPLYYIDRVLLYTDFVTVITARSTSDYAFLEFFTTFYRAIIWFIPSLESAAVKYLSVCGTMTTLLIADYLVKMKNKGSMQKQLFSTAFILAMFSSAILLIHPHSEMHIMVYAYPAIILSGMFALKAMKLRFVVSWFVLYGLFFPLLWVQHTPITFFSLVLFNIYCFFIAYCKSGKVDVAVDGWSL